MNKNLLRQCPVCNNKTAEILHSQSFVLPQGHLLSAVKEYDIVSCLECGFVFADTSGSQQTYDRYYADMSKYESDNSTVDINRQMAQAKLIASYMSDKNCKIIDVGCGNGGLLMALKELGYNNLTALDPSVTCAANINKEGITAEVGDIFNNKIKDKYDMVILSHVMEHIVNVSEAMKVIVSFLSDKGILYIEVPDASSYANNYVVPFYYFDTEHINHFEEVSLINIGLINGLETISINKKIIDASANVKYPAIFAVYKKSGVISDWKSSAKNKILRFIEDSKRMSEDQSKIDLLLKENREVIIWGAGNYTMRLIDNTKLGKCNIIGFIDKDEKKQGMIIAGKTVYEPAKAKKISPQTVVVVCSAIYSEEIVLELKNMGVKNEVVVLK